MLDEIGDLVSEIINPRYWRFWFCLALSILGAWLACGHLPPGGLRIGASVAIVVFGVVGGILWESTS